VSGSRVRRRSYAKLDRERAEKLAFERLRLWRRTQDAQYLDEELYGALDVRMTERRWTPGHGPP
jgi:hypothetical protein